MIPFVGGSYTLDVRKADVQRTVNMFPVASENAGSAEPTYLQSIPGVDLFSDTAPPLQVGWFEPPSSDDAETINPSNRGFINNTGSFGQIRPHCGVMREFMPAPEIFVECYLESWTPVTPGELEPTQNGEVAGQLGTQEVQPRFDGGFHLVQGVAVFRFRIGDGDTFPGRLILTTYLNDETGGYGGIAWECIP